MLTTAMLTAINDLRRAKKSIFFLATNRLRAFDSAIIRPGRFDMQLFVGTPNLEARIILLRSQLESVPVSQDDKDAAEEAFRSFLLSVWENDAMFFNFLESQQVSDLKVFMDSMVNEGALTVLHPLLLCTRDNSLPSLPVPVLMSLQEVVSSRKRQ